MNHPGAADIRSVMPGLDISYLMGAALRLADVQRAPGANGRRAGRRNRRAGKRTAQALPRRRAAPVSTTSAGQERARR